MPETVKQYLDQAAGVDGHLLVLHTAHRVVAVLVIDEVNPCFSDGVEIHRTSFTWKVIQWGAILGTPLQHVPFRTFDLMAELGVRFAVAQHVLGSPLGCRFAQQQILGHRVSLGPFHGGRAWLVWWEPVLVVFDELKGSRAFGPRMGLGRGEAGVLGGGIGGGHAVSLLAASRAYFSIAAMSGSPAVAIHCLEASCTIARRVRAASSIFLRMSS